MNKADLINALADELDESKVNAERIVNTLLDLIKKGLKKENAVQIAGFGTFKVVQRKARKGRNPRTGETIDIAASKSVGFKVGKTLKESL